MLQILLCPFYLETLYLGINTEHHVTLKLFKSDGSLVTTLYDGICILKEKKTSLECIPNCTDNNPLSIVVTFEDI